MPPGSDVPSAAEQVAQTQKQIRGLTEDIARLSLADLTPADYFQEFLQRVLAALAAPSGAVWERTPDGHFQQLCVQNPGRINRDWNEAERLRHDELLRQAIQGRPIYVPALETEATGESKGAARGGLPGWAIFLAPIFLEQEVVALVEVWHSPQRDPQAVPGLMQFLIRAADLASVYLLHQRQKQAPSQEELWERLDSFTQRIHGSLRPAEVAYLVANEGRQLLGGDRLSVAVREGRSVSIEAISGVDIVDRRSNLVRRMKRLCTGVVRWGEKLVYRGVADESLPPDVLRDLDAYLEESHSKVLILLPLRDEREKEGKKLPQSALLLECFESTIPVEQLLERLEVVARHATGALYNAVQHRQIPLRFLWSPLAKVQSGLGGKTKAILASIIAAIVIVLAVLIFVPYPLKMAAKGQLLPEERRWIYAPVEGQIVRFEDAVQPGAPVGENQSLVLLYDVQLESKLVQLTHEVSAAQHDVEALAKQLNAATTEADRLRSSAEKKQKEALRERKFWELRHLRERTHSEESRPGNFWLKAPVAGTVLNWDFRETLTNRQVKPSEPLLRIGDKTKRWEVELKIPQKHMGQIIQAFKAGDASAELDVDLLVTSAPTRTFKGKLSRNKIAGEASVNREETTESEPVVLASVRIDGPGIAAEDRVPGELFTSGTEVHAKVRCGNHAMGYSLFYGLWEFLYEKVVFFF